MKKILIALILVCVLFAGFISYQESGLFALLKAEPVQSTEATAVQTPGPVTEVAESVDTIPETVPEEEQKSAEIDYAALYASHQPDEVIAKVADQEVTWGQYFYSFYSYAKQIEELMMYAPLYYGTEVSWDDVYNPDTGETYRDVPGLAAENEMLSLSGIKQYCKENGFEFNDECRKMYEEQLKATMASTGVETEEDFFKQLQEVFVSRDVFDNQVKTNILSELVYNSICGENGSKISEEDAKKYLDEKGYYHCMHILLTNFNSETGEALPEEEYAAKKAQAEEILAQLNAEKDPEKRKQLFLTLAEQYNEDSGTEYIFAEGEAVGEFEKVAKNLSDYECAIAESTYGLHVIMKLPLGADDVLSSTGTSARQELADELFSTVLSEYISSLKFEYSEGFEKPVIGG